MKQEITPQENSEDNNDDVESFAADVPYSLNGDWLLEWFRKNTTPSTLPDVPWDCDPDDYPVY